MAAPHRRFDILHLRHNWWRWREMSQSMLPATERVRGRVGEIGFDGSWWMARLAKDHGDAVGVEELVAAFRGQVQCAPPGDRV